MVEIHVGRVKKMLKKILKNQSMTHVFTTIFQGVFKNIDFRSVALVIEKLWAILDFFFTDRTFTAL